MSDQIASHSNVSFGGFRVDSCGSLPTVPEMIIKYAESQPDAVALACNGRRRTWAELDERTARIGSALLARGVKPGDRVALVSAPLNEAIESYLGIVRIGACAVPLPTMVASAALSTMVRDSEATFIFASNTTQSLVEGALEGADVIGHGSRVGLDFGGDGWAEFEEFVSSGSPRLLGPAIPPEAEFNIIYSSGTTGAPKGIVHSHRIRSYQAAGMGSAYADRRVALISTPIYSNLTLWGVLTAIWAGGTVLLLPKFNARECLALIARERPSLAFLVPLQLQRLLAEPDFSAAVSGLITLKVCSGSPLSPALKRAVVASWPGGLLEVYGMTEGAPTTFMLVEEHMDKLASVGKAAEGALIKIIDESGKELPPHAIGEIVGRTNTMMDRYNNRPKESEALVWHDINGDKYFRSGDLGYLDDDGFLYLSDRLKDMIISGGANIYPSDIETVLMEHPAVAEVAVVGVPHPQWGETPSAVVVLRGGLSEAPANLLEWANRRLGRLQRLAGVEVRDSLPRNSLGKILKGELRRQLSVPAAIPRSSKCPSSEESANAP